MLLVGAIGVANIMIISVLERRRRSGCGGRWALPRARYASSSWRRPSCSRWPAAPRGAAISAAATAVYAHNKREALVIPAEAWAGARRRDRRRCHSPGCCPPSAPPGCPPPKRYGAEERGSAPPAGGGAVPGPVSQAGEPEATVDVVS